MCYYFIKDFKDIKRLKCVGIVFFLNIDIQHNWEK